MSKSKKLSRLIDLLIYNTTSKKLKWKQVSYANGKIVIKTINHSVDFLFTKLGKKLATYVLNFEGRDHYPSSKQGDKLLAAISQTTPIGRNKPIKTYREEYIKTVGRLEEQFIPPSEDIELIPTKVNVTSAIIVCENEHHDIYDVIGLINTMTPSSKVIRLGIPTFYCKNCNKHYMYKSYFGWARQHGILMCRIQKEVVTYNTGNFDLREKSILKEYGYDVSKENDYSSQYRQSLLQYLMDNDIVRKQKILNLLEFFISSHEGNMNFADACYKWSCDRDYVSKYHKGDSKRYTIEISEIIYKVSTR